MSYKIFISGSIKIKSLDSFVLERINNIIKSKFEVIVGDANGVDSSIQQYLYKKGVESVKVYCSSETPRNNIGQWHIKHIRTSKKPGTREFFTAKDLSMAEDCDYGLMVWDGKSSGTLKNAFELLIRNKKSTVFISKQRKFIDVKKADDFNHLLSYMNSSDLLKVNSKLKLQNKLEEIINKQGELF